MSATLNMGVERPAVKPIRNTRDHYKLVNSLWPKGLPKLEGPEAVSAAKRLWRVATGKAWKGTWAIGRGNHRTYPRGSRFLVNPHQGWHDMVHDLSHAAHMRVNRRGKPHDGDHARLEAKLIRYVVDHGWLDGKLKPKPKAVPSLEDKTRARLQRVAQLIKGWETKAKRANTALKKLRAEQARLLRKLG
ncbi:MAG: hypothetical protein J2P48_06925 [Alphaproteobacteria bacterium]|nr:hypothetical protein [Alphaproteobacteria bacterium]